MEYLAGGQIVAAYADKEFTMEVATLSANNGKLVRTPLDAPIEERTDAARHRRLDIDDDGIASVRDTLSGVDLFTLDNHGEGIESGAFSPDGTRLITRSVVGVVTTWDAADGAELTTMEGTTQPVGYARLSADNSRALCCNHVSVRVCDATTGTIIFETARPKRSRLEAAFLHCSRELMTRVDNAVRIWDTEKPKEPLVIQGAIGDVPTVNLNGTIAAMTSADNSLQLIETTTGNRLSTLTGHTDHIYITQFCADGARLATASWDKTLRLWDTGSGKLMAMIEVQGSIRKAAFSADGTRLWTLLDDGGVIVWNVQGGKKAAEISASEADAQAAACTPDLRATATAASDQSLSVWDTFTGRKLCHIPAANTERVRYIYLNPEATRIVIATAKGMLVWDATNGQRLQSIAVAARANPALSPDAEFLAGGTNEAPRIAAIYRMSAAPNKAGEEPFLLLEGHDAPLRCASYSPDGTRVITGSNDKTARVWDAATGEILAVLEGHEGAVTSAWFSPDGMRVMTLTDANTLRIWNAYPYRDDQLPSLAEAARNPYPGEEGSPWKMRFRLWKQQRYAEWLAKYGDKASHEVRAGNGGQ